jgi:hypothetical protein
MPDRAFVPAEPVDDDFPTTVKVSRVLATRVRALRTRGGFKSAAALIEHLCRVTENDLSLLLPVERGSK